MSRRLEPTDVAAIQKLRAKLKEEHSSHSSNTQEEQSTLDDPTLDPLHQDLLTKDKVIDLRIVGHSVVACPNDDKEFASYQIEVKTVDLCYLLSRRFSEFHQLYRQVRKCVNLKCEFPRKVYNPFVSSTSPVVVEQRSGKLHYFLKEVLNHVRTSREPAVTSLLFCFLSLKQHYQQKQLAPSYKKCNSQKLAYYRMLSMKPALSEGLRLSQNEDSLQFKLLLLATNGNSAKCLREIDDFVKARRGKLSLDEAKMLFVGDGQCPGLLKFGLSNVNEASRVQALEILLGLLLPQRNPQFERFQKVLERLLTEEWRVQEVGLFDSSLFKLQYFRLLALYCERMEREYSRQQTTILKDLFLFHQDLFDDYFSWKKMHQREIGLKTHFELQATFDRACKIELNDFEEDYPEFVQVASSQQPLRSVYYSRSAPTIVIYLQSSRVIPLEELQQWNSFTSAPIVDEFTSVIRGSFALPNKRIPFRARTFKPTEAASLLEQRKAVLKQLGEIEEGINVREECQAVLLKEEYPAEIESEFWEVGWIKHQEDSTHIMMVLYFEGGLGGQMTVEQFGKHLFDDLVTKFPL